MSFTVRLSDDTAQVEAGATAAITVEIANRTESADRYEVQVEGLDPEWTAIPVPSFSVDAQGNHSEKLFLKPPRSSESMAGTYPFVVKARSLESGDARTVQGVLQIKTFNHVSLDVAPKRGTISAFGKQCAFEVTVMNLGNSDHTMQLFASDPDDALVFEFESDKIMVGPGQQKAVVLDASATRKPLLANPRLHSFGVTARSVDTPSVMASVQAQLEQRAFVSPGTFALFFFAFLLIGGWIALIPKPPVIDSVSLSKREITLGQPVTVRWRASNAKTVKIEAGGEVLFDAVEPNGERDFVPEKAGTLLISAVAMNGDKRSSGKNDQLVVKEPVKLPPPEIIDFKIVPANLAVNQTFVVKYKLGRYVAKAILVPTGTPLDPKINEIELVATRAGTIVYKIVAENSDGRAVEKSITVHVIDKSLASFVKFDATPNPVDPLDGRVRITWQLTNAARAELKQGDQVVEVDKSGGTREVAVSQETVLTLIAYDDQGRTVEKKIRIRVREVKPPTEPVPNPGSATGGGG